MAHLGSIVGEGVPAATAADMVPHADVSAAFRRMQVRQWDVRRRPVAERVAALRRLKRAIITHRAAILDAMHADFRKNRSEAELSEIQLVLTELNEAISRTPSWTKPTRVSTPLHLPGTRSAVHYEPRGVVLIMAAWNYPFALIFAPLVPAVAAGNCVMVRPSEKVPHTSAVAARIIADTFDADEVLMVAGDRQSADHLLSLPFDHVFFTGSSAVGRKIMASASRHLSSVTLELGGKCPAIVDETADLGEAARAIMWGKFVNAGQTCVAPDYVVLHASIADRFFDAARRTLAAFYGDSEDARQANGDYCRIIDDENWSRLAGLLEQAVGAGARIEIGGRSDPAERYIAPTLLSHVPPDSPIMQAEIFGPLLPALTYRDRGELFDLLRERPKPLAMYVFSTNEANVREVLGRTAAGGTVINNCLIHLVNPGLPFGGVGESGFGSYHGRHGFAAFSHARAVVRQGRPRVMNLFHPPYARLREGRLGALLAFVRRLRE